MCNIIRHEGNTNSNLHKQAPPTRVGNIADDTERRQGCRRTGTGDENVQWCSHLGKTINLNIHLLYDLFLDIYPRKMKTHVYIRTSQLFL